MFSKGLQPRNRAIYRRLTQEWCGLKQNQNIEARVRLSCMPSHYMSYQLLGKLGTRQYFQKVSTREIMQSREEWRSSESNDAHAHAHACMSIACHIILYHILKWFYIEFYYDIIWHIVIILSICVILFYYILLYHRQHNLICYAIYHILLYNITRYTHIVIYFRVMTHVA